MNGEEMIVTYVIGEKRINEDNNFQSNLNVGVQIIEIMKTAVNQAADSIKKEESN
jgi:hypothetical protein